MVSSGRWVALRPMRWMRLVGPSPSWSCRRPPQALEAFEAQGQVGAALGAGDRVDLVDDHVLDALEDLAGLAGQQEVQALGGRDEDVRRVANEVAALVGGGVAGARGDRDAGRLVAQAGGLVGDAGEGGAEVALDVVGQRLQRADVEDADGAGLFACGCRAWVLDEPVEAPQERGEGLAAAGRGVDQRVPALGDGRPALGLGRRRGLERRLEPGPDGGPERGKRIGLGRDHGTASIEPTSHFDQMFDSSASGGPRPLTATAPPVRRGRAHRWQRTLSARTRSRRASSAAARSLSAMDPRRCRRRCAISGR